MFNYKKINYLISELKDKKKNLRVEDIAREAGVSKSMFDNIKSGKSNPTVEVLEKIAIYFCKDMNYFFDTMISVEVQKQQPVINASPNEYMAKRIEDLAVENTLLKRELEDYKSKFPEGYTLPDVQNFKAPENTIELKEKTV